MKSLFNVVITLCGLFASTAVEAQTVTKPDFDFKTPDGQMHKVHVDTARGMGGPRLKISADGVMVGIVQVSNGGQSLSVLGGTAPANLLTDASKIALGQPVEGHPEAQPAGTQTASPGPVVPPQPTATQPNADQRADLDKRVVDLNTRTDALLHRTSVGSPDSAGDANVNVQFTDAGIVVTGIIKSPVTLNANGTNIQFDDVRAGHIELNFEHANGGHTGLGAAGAMLKGSINGGAEVRLKNNFYTISARGQKIGTTGDHTAGASMNSERMEGGRQQNERFAYIGKRAIEAVQTATSAQGKSFSPPDEAVKALAEFSKNVNPAALRLEQ